MPSLPFVTGGAVTSELKTDGAGIFLGFWFRNDSGEDVVITDLGRWQRTGNSQTHSLRVYGTTGHLAIGTLLGSVSVNCSGATAGGWLWGTLSSPVTIAPGGQCCIVSEEFSGGDTFGSNGGTAFVTTDIGSTWSSYVLAGITYKNPDSGRGFGPTNFKYSAPVAAWSKAGNVYTTDGNRYSVQSAINDSTTGDIIDIPAGSFTWGAGAAYLALYKAVTLRGAGTGATTITISGSGSQWANGTIRISAAATVKDLTITQTGGGNCTAISASGADGWRVSNVVYNSAASSGYFVYFANFGLIDNCTVIGGSGSDEWIFGRGPSDAWQSPSQKGTANAVYVENCTLSAKGYLDANANANVVVRNCTIAPSGGSIKLDGHGTATNSPPRSFRLMECYRNNWTTTNSNQPCFEIRGGTAFIWGNTALDGTIMLGDYRIVYGTNTVGDYPLYDQPGTGQDPFPASAAAEPLYLWNNLRAGSNWNALTQIYAADMAGLVNPNRDFFDKGASFDGSSGVGTGTKAQMDAITPTTTGVGFWVTDEGSWDTTLSANTSGRFYRWNGSAWVLYYTPYTYPHPLRGEASAPAFTTNPVSQTISSGEDVGLTVAVTGNPTPILQWRLDGDDIPGETTTALVLLDLTTSGVYDCVATNSEGTATSEAAVVTVLPSPGLGTGNPLAFRSNAMLAMGAF